MKIKPWMYGVGVLGVAGVGIALYEVFKTTTPAASGASATGASLTPPAVPAVAATRPVAPTGTAIFGAFPTGPVLDFMGSGTLSASLASGQNLTVVLPAGASWTAVALGSTANPNAALGQVQLGGDSSSPVSIPYDGLPYGTNELVAGWKDKSGVAHMTVVTFPVRAKLIPLKLRA